MKILLVSGNGAKIARGPIPVNFGPATYTGLGARMHFGYPERAMRIHLALVAAAGLGAATAAGWLAAASGAPGAPAAGTGASRAQIAASSARASSVRDPDAGDELI